MNYQRRLDGLRERMARDGLDLVAYGPSPDFQYLTGIPLGRPADGIAADLIVPRDGEPILVASKSAGDVARDTWLEDVRLGGSIEDAVVELAPSRCRIGMGRDLSDGASVALASAAGECIETNGLMDHLRAIKEPEEVERLRAAAKLTDQVFDAIIPGIRAGVTQPELEAEIERHGRRLGASDVSFPPAAIFTKSGTEPSPDPFVYPKDEGLAPGTAIAFDFGFVVDGYCSDFGRGLYFGRPDEHIRMAYQALQTAMRETVGRMHDGSMTFRDIFPAMEAELDKLGYGDYLRARLPDGVLGHQIGVEVHENPWINPACGDPIRTNMVMAIEPKLWHSGEYYLRVEDIILVSDKGSEFLTNADREVFEL